MGLREVMRDDLPLVLGWRNHPSVRHAMLSSEIISYDEHLRWFEQTLASESSIHLIFEHDAEPQGVVYIHDWSGDSKIGKWGFYKRPYAKRGMGRIMCREALDYFFCELGAQEIKAEVLINNNRSLDLHLDLGFIPNEKVRQFLNADRPVEIWRLSMFANQWKDRAK